MRPYPALVFLLAACTPAPAPEATSTPASAAVAEASAPATVAPVPSAPSAETAAAGPDPALARLVGRISYPSEELPAMRLCAVDSADPGSAICTRTEVNQAHYTLDVPAGQWWLLAWPQGTGTAADPGLLSEASECLGSAGLDCNDHGLLTVIVSAGETREGLDINDWYYNPSEYPPPMEPQDATP